MDQTGTNELDEVVIEFNANLPIKHVRIPPCGISEARNQGLKHITGDWVAFPDDDCAYSPGLLQKVFQCLEKDPSLDGISCFVCDDLGEGSAGGLMARREIGITVSNVWKTVVSCSFFLRRSVVEPIGGFDEQLGVGAKSGCWAGEETDWILRLLDRGAHIVYRPDLTVFHPQPDFTQPDGLHKAFRYGRGAGRVLRKHHYPIWFIGASVAFQLVRAIGELLHLRPRNAMARFAMAVGRLFGR